MKLINADELREQCHTIPDPKGRYCGLDIIEKYEIDDVSTVFDIPNNPTNGDMIKIIFPNMKVDISGGVVKSDRYTQFDLIWWNTPYQKRW